MSVGASDDYHAREAAYVPILRAAFEAEGLPPEWGPAIAAHESCFKPGAEAHAGGDGLRGGAYGLCQLTLATTRELGYTGDGQGLLNPEVNARLAAKYCGLLVDRWHTRDLREIAAAYNSGRPFKRAPETTRLLYVPQVLAYAKHYARLAERQAQGKDNARGK